MLGLWHFLKLTEKIKGKVPLNFLVQIFGWHCPFKNCYLFGKVQKLKRTNHSSSIASNDNIQFFIIQCCKSVIHTFFKNIALPCLKYVFELTVSKLWFFKNCHGSFTLPSQWGGDKGMSDCFTGPSHLTVQLRGWARTTSTLQLQVCHFKKKFLYNTILAGLRLGNKISTENLALPI